MLLRTKFICKCGCTYEVDENISLDKIACPNCGMVHEYSDQIVRNLKLFKSIDDSTADKVLKNILSQDDETFKKASSLEEILKIK